jgi:MtN3 and saliva related transmembrane protein
MVEVDSFLGYIAGSLVTISLVPQLITILYNKDSKNVSIFTYIILLVARILWTTYGLRKLDFQIGITNCISGVLTIFIIISAIYYRNKKND